MCKMDLCTKQMSLVFRRVGSVLGQHNSSIKVTHCCRHIRVISTSAIKPQEFPETPGFSQDVQPAPAAIVRPHLPVITARKLEHIHPCLTPQQAWLETLDTIEDEKLGVIDLHPEIFATNPRIDILHRNVQWQTTYSRINYEKTKSRAELRGGGRKPWPQKGMNKARHGSIRSPLWVNGGKATGPRGPKSYFYMLPTPVRVLGLRVALSVKYAQNDLHIVDSLKIPTDEEKYIEDLVEQRHWGYSALFVDVKDFMPRNISLALSKTKEFNLMPVYGLNVYSILKHETLVLTLDAVEELEKKLLYEMHKTETDTKFHSHRGITSYSVPDWR